MRRFPAFLLGAGLLAPARLCAQAPSEHAAIEATVRDYIEGYFAGDASRMERALHPELAKRRVLQAEGRTRIQHMDAARLVDFTRRSKSFGHTTEDARIRELKVVWVRGPLAMAVAETGAFVDACQLAKVDGAWKLVNVIWCTQPVPR